jgi:FKBP-type peptidyl-prolyl cis-trans isomerase SlyD
MSKRYTVNYWLMNEAGEVVDTSEKGEPMVIVPGSTTSIEGLQKAVDGRSVGDRIEVTIPPELAYGVHNAEFISEVDIAMFDGIEKVVPGMKFQTNTGEQTQIVQVMEVDGNRVVVDANHPLAGLPLVFELEIVSVEDIEASER